MRNRLSAAALFCATLLLCSTAAAADAEVVFAVPGPDASTQLQVSWHAAAAGSRLEYTKKTDTAFAHSSFVDCGTVPRDTTFSTNSFYRCKALLDGLETDTEYAFRIGSSAGHGFKTAYGRGPFSFVWMSDIHAYPSIPGRITKAEALLARAEQLQSDLAFVLVTGDLTAHGATYAQWQELTSSFTNSYALPTTPGNHDYYDSSAAYVDDRYYNAALFNPANGAPGVANTSYWFRYGNALFISINSEGSTAEKVAATKAWLRQVITDSPAQYVIAFTHRAFFNGSTTTAGSGTVRSAASYSNYGALLEELGVDLALGGDFHVYVRTKELNGGQVATGGRGTVYLSANQIGDRGALAAASLGEFGAAIYGGTSSSGSISTASVITINDTSIDGVLIDPDGTVRDSFSIPARRPAPVDTFDKDAYARSFAARVNPPDLTRGVLGFTAEGWDRVRTIEVRDAQSGATYATFTPGSGMTERTFQPLEAGRTYQLAVHTLFKDNDTRDVSRVLVNKVSPGTCRNLRLEKAGQAVLLKWENELVPAEIGSIEVSVNDSWRTEAAVDAESVEVTSGLREGANTVGFAVVDRYGDEVFDQSLTWDHAPGADAGVPTTDGGGEAADAGQGPGDRRSGQEAVIVAAEGCGCASSGASPMTLLLAFAGFGALARRRPECSRLPEISQPGRAGSVSRFDEEPITQSRTSIWLAALPDSYGPSSPGWSDGVPVIGISVPRSSPRFPHTARRPHSPELRVRTKPRRA